MKKLFLFSLWIAVMSCSTGHQQLPSDHFIPGLAGPLRLDKDQSQVVLTDFVPMVEIIDSVIFNGEKAELSPDKSLAYLHGTSGMDPLENLQIWSKGNYLSVMVMKSRKINFAYSFDPGNKIYKKVQLSGEWNGWTPSRTELKYENGRWVTGIVLNPGRYQYQIVLDGIQGLDPGNPDSVDNNLGGFNSVLTAGLADKSKQPFIFTREFDEKEGEISIEWTVRPDEFYVYWQNICLDNSYLEFENEEMSIQIPEEASGFERSYIRVYAYNEGGLANDILVPLEKGKVVMDPGKLNRNDREARIIYNVFIDRFFNADTSNDGTINNPAIVLPPADYFGGDIKGITQKIKEGYFSSLGVNTLWISPVVENPKGAYGQWKDPDTKFSAYHGYWPVSFTKTDSRLGTPGELKELVSEAHKAGMNVLLDFVAHHVHELHPYYIQYPDRTTSLYLPDGTLNTEKWDEHRLTTWFDVFLPTLDLQNPEVTEMLADSATWWITEYGLDGFRHDATKHVPEIFWRTLTRKLKQQVVISEGRPVYQIGETYGGPELISSYVGAGMLDGQFDFNVYDAALGVFARDDDPFTNLDNVLQTSFDYYGYHNLMGYITGNQDRARFISYAGGDLKFSENAKAAGWRRNIGVGDPSGYKKLSMLTAFNMTIPGLPVIYYGDELGIPGGNDPDSRRMMKFNDLTPYERETREKASELIRIRKENMALLYGTFTTLECSQKAYVYMRQYFDQAAIIILNKDNSAQDVSIQLPAWINPENLKPEFGNSFSIKDRKLEIRLEPWSFEILTGK